jgi:preprotein translocase subunit SecY
MLNKELWKKIGFVFLGLAIFRMGSHIPVPGIDAYALSLMFQQTSGTIIDMFNSFSGGSLKRLSIFAIGVMPYISASIILQILTLVNPTFKAIKEEGLKGQIKIAQYTRYLTLLIGTFQAIGLINSVSGQAVNGLPVIPDPSLSFYIIAILSLLAGTMSVVWIAEKITEYGIGNGMSIIIFASIVSNIPTSISGTMELVKNGELSPILTVVVLALVITTLMIVVLMEKSQRRIPVVNSRSDEKHANKSFLPFKVNMAGVLPPIIASSLMLLPSTLGAWLSGTTDVTFLQKIGAMLNHGSYIYLLVFASMVVGFSYMFNSLQHNPYKTAENLKNSGTFIRGFMPGKKTGDYLNKMMNRLTFIGATYLAIVCIIPEILIYSWNIPFYFGGTSILIMVMVALDWQTQIKAHYRSNDYKNIKNEIANELK